MQPSLVGPRRIPLGDPLATQEGFTHDNLLVTRHRGGRHLRARAPAPDHPGRIRPRRGLGLARFPRGALRQPLVVTAAALAEKIGASASDPATICPPMSWPGVTPPARFAQWRQQISLAHHPSLYDRLRRPTTGVATQEKAKPGSPNVGKTQPLLARCAAPPSSNTLDGAPTCPSFPGNLPGGSIVRLQIVQRDRLLVQVNTP